MKKLITLATLISLTACGTISHVTPGVTSEAYAKAEKACGRGNVHMVTQTVLASYTAFCGNGEKHDI